MSTSLHDFVAEDLWMVIALVTVTVVAIFGVLGFETVAGVLSILGLVLLVPLFLFWGGEIAAFFVGESPDTVDPIEALQLAYATGEIDEETFEAKLETLLQNDPDAFAEASLQEREPDVE